MPPRKKPPETEGHNLSGDDEHALFIHHLSKLRAQDKLVAEAKAKLDAERAVLNDLFHKAKVDKFTRKELREVLDDSAAVRRDLQAVEERRAKLRGWAGLPVGAQGDLFDRLPEEVKDEQAYEGTGYSAGLRGDPGVVPEDISPRFVQAWMRGWNAGQEKLAWGLAAAGRLVDRASNANATPVQLEPEPDEQTVIDMAARKLRKAGFTERTADTSVTEPAV